MIQMDKLLPGPGLALVLLFAVAGCDMSPSGEGSNSPPASEPAGSASSSDKAKAGAYEPPRNSRGEPDLEGIWDFRTLTPLERPAMLGDKATFTEEEQQAFTQLAIQATDVDNLRDGPAEQDIEGAYNSFWMDFGTQMNEDRRTSLIVDPQNGRLPALTPEAQEGRKNFIERKYPVREFFSIGLQDFRPVGPEALGLSERCLLGFNAGPPIMPSAYNNNLRVVQTPTHVVLITEMIHNARIIPIDGRRHLPKELTEWSGDSRGHWEGDTLVIENANFTNKTPTFQLPATLEDPTNIGAVGMGKNMQLTERLTRIGESALLYEYTLNDPATFVTPFTVVIPMRASESQMFEYACHEGNYGMAGILRGARQMEKEQGG